MSSELTVVDVDVQGEHAIAAVESGEISVVVSGRVEELTDANADELRELARGAVDAAAVYAPAFADEAI